LIFAGYGPPMDAVNVVERFGADGYLERSWILPAKVASLLRDHVDMTDTGWIMYLWDVTPGIAVIVQPYVDEPIDPESGVWFVSSEQA
jgi:hypothetical protein